ncbi:hypothetical protein, partial [Sulfitobacter sp.]|uniref:hypothetical protein n=1 Tax=Sulfitobacter sp. TaxID=1903071 RepID=UPI0030028038
MKRYALHSAIAALMMIPGMGSAESPVLDAPVQTATPSVYGAVQVDTADRAIPSAQEVIIDLPSAFYAARHQRGEINGLSYVLFPDGSGKTMQINDRRDVLFRLECKKGISCTIIGSTEAKTVIPAVGASKPIAPSAPSGADLARYLAEWVLACSGEPPKDAPLENAAIEDAEPEATAVSITAPAPVQVVEKHTTLTKKIAQVLPSQPQNEKVQPPEPIQKAKRSMPRSKATPTVAPYRPARSQAIIHRTTAPAPAAAGPQTIFQRIKLNYSITGSVTLKWSGKIGQRAKMYPTRT